MFIMYSLPVEADAGLDSKDLKFCHSSHLRGWGGCRRVEVCTARQGQSREWELIVFPGSGEITNILPLL